MAPRTVSVEQLGLETAKVVGQARRSPILVRDAQGGTLVLRALADDDIADELIVQHPKFRASIRRARRNRAAGKGIPLQQALDELGTKC